MFALSFLGASFTRMTLYRAIVPALQFVPLTSLVLDPLDANKPGDTNTATTTAAATATTWRRQ